MNLASEATETIQAYGQKLLNENRSKWDSFESAADFTVNKIYTDFETDTGHKLFALVRIFKMITPDQLPLEGLQSVEDTGQWLGLMATTGIEPAWNNRLDSEGHRLLPSGAFETPMLKATFEQLDLIRKNIDDKFIKSIGSMANYFHVEQAEGSPYIVAQEEFVKPYGVQSVIGLGSLFMDRSLYLLLGFATTPISKSDAKKFSHLSPYISTLMASYVRPDIKIWKSV